MACLLCICVCFFLLLCARVLSWVLTDYKSATLNLDDPSVYRDLSRPVGALNEDRFEIYQERFQTFDDPEIPGFMSGEQQGCKRQ